MLAAQQHQQRSGMSTTVAAAAVAGAARRLALGVPALGLGTFAAGARGSTGLEPANGTVNRSGLPHATLLHPTLLLQSQTSLTRWRTERP